MVKHTRDVALIAGVVYFIQGAIGLSGIALPIFLRSLKWSVAEITAVTSVAAAPWVVKILYGLVSDTYPLFGFRRKPYLILASFCSSLGWLGLVVLPPEKHWILMSLLISNLGFAATDVITDGLIVEHSTGFTSPIYQAIAWGTRAAGSLASGFLGGILAQHWPPKYVFALTMVLPVAVTIAACWILEKKMEPKPIQLTAALESLGRLLKLMLSHNLRWFSVLLVVFAVSSTFGLPFFFHLKETLGFRESFLGLLQSLGWGGAMFGSLIYARWLRKVPPKLTLRCAMLLNCVNIISALFITTPQSAMVLIFFGGVMGCLVMLPIMSSAAAFTHNSGVEGTLFAVLMSIFNMGQIVFGFLGGHLFEKVGLQPLILGTAGAAFLGVLIVGRLRFEKAAA